MPTPTLSPSADLTDATAADGLGFAAELDIESYEVEEIPLERRLNPDGSYVELVDGKPIVIERRQRNE